ncbi:MAG: SCO family protein [Gammaproteobacteria bacterium]|nr:SCO family protein [Gammaproteobacteria bacterium]
MSNHAEQSSVSGKIQPDFKNQSLAIGSPGSYQLPRLFSAGDGSVLTDDGQPVQLHALIGEKITLLSFIYSTCRDVDGCPLATAMFYRLSNRLKDDAEIREQLRLITLSFNPVDDAPEVMRQYGQDLKQGGLDWHFLTTESEEDLAPILKSYRQTVQKNYNEAGQFTGTFSHVLRVYLIDQEKTVRNIYSTSFLNPDSLISDVKTLLADKQRIISRTKADTFNQVQSLQQIKQTEVESPAFELITNIQNPPLGLPELQQPDANPATSLKIKLGRKLFFDRRLSLNSTMSCAMCHIPQQGFTSHEMKTAVGFEGRTVSRNSPTLYNVGYGQAFFHDGRETTLENQVWGPLLASNEMANPSIGFVIQRIKNSPDYQGMFEQAFSRPVAVDTIGMALAAYQRSLNAANSRFDQWKYGGEEQSLNAAEKLGYTIFTGKGGCVTCHSIGEKSALFMDHAYHNTGVGYNAAMSGGSDKQRIQLAPGVFVDVDQELIDEVSEPVPNDLGRYAVTLDPNDRWKYKTPSLRNIELTAPYMHNGEFQTLDEVIALYNQGGIANPLLDQSIKPLNLSNTEQKALKAFLLTLTGDNVGEIVKDALSEPVGDPH